MARTQIPIESVSERAVTTKALALWARLDSVNGYEWAAVPGDLLLITNTAATTPTFTVVRPVNAYGRGADYTSPAVAQYAVRAFRVPRLDGWAQSDGTIHIDTASNDLRFCVFRFNPPLRSGS